MNINIFIKKVVTILSNLVLVILLSGCVELLGVLMAADPTSSSNSSNYSANGNRLVVKVDGGVFKGYVVVYKDGYYVDSKTIVSNRYYTFILPNGYYSVKLKVGDKVLNETKIYLNGSKSLTYSL